MLPSQSPSALPLKAIAIVLIALSTRPPLASAFTASQFSGVICSRPTSVLAAGKGFGNKNSLPPPKGTGKGFSGNGSSSPATASEDTPSTSIAESFAATTPESNTSSPALKELRRREAERRDAELRKVRELREADTLLSEDGGAAVIPEKVAQRMGKRMLPFVGIPLFGSFASFIGFWYLATQKDMEFQPALVAGTSVVFLLIGLLGITYSLLSASWDDDREGSVLGGDEFQKNIENLKDGLSRTKENAILREKMAGLSESEIQRALDDQERREKSKIKKDSRLEALQDAAEE